MADSSIKTTSTSLHSANTNITTSPPITLRPAHLLDHTQIAHLSARAFYNDILFGHIIHPNRRVHPTHMSRYWLSRNLIAHFDWSHRFVVAVVHDSSSKKETIVGVIHWSLITMPAPDMVEHPATRAHRLPWWDPRRLLQPLVALLVKVASLPFLPLYNRAAAPEQEQIIEASEPFLSHIWDTARQRSPSWYIESMAVDPQWQGRGVGRMLVQEGMQLAESEGVCASVISAEGKEEFYRRGGFTTGPVGRSGCGGRGNPLAGVPGGLVWFRDVRGGDGEVEKGREEEREREVRECGKWLRRDIEEGGWRCAWLEKGGKGYDIWVDGEGQG